MRSDNVIMNLTSRPADLIVIILYLLGMAGLGFWFSRRNKTTEEYFLGGRARLPRQYEEVSMKKGIAVFAILAFAVTLSFAGGKAPTT